MSRGTNHNKIQTPSRTRKTTEDANQCLTRVPHQLPCVYCGPNHHSFTVSSYTPSNSFVIMKKAITSSFPRIALKVKQVNSRSFSNHAIRCSLTQGGGESHGIMKVSPMRGLVSNTVQTKQMIEKSTQLLQPHQFQFPQHQQQRSVTTLSLTSKKRRGKKITMVTAYDYPSAMHVQRANIDMILVGDSAAMVELGYDTTQPMTLDQMIHHCQAVHRGVVASVNVIKSKGMEKPKVPLLVGDMPFGTYEYQDLDIALKNAYKLVKDGGMDAIKLEGGSQHRARTIRHVVDGGVAVMGHIGLTPQAISVIGGFRAQGRTATRARELIDEALRLQDAGAFALVLECVPSNVARAVTETLEIPTIGIGAGGGTSGQVLVYHDMLGMMSHPHHEEFMPKFCKRYASVGHAITEGLDAFKREVEDGTFPGEKYSPYVMNDEEEKAFELLLEQDEAERDRKHQEAAKKLKQADEYEQLSLYGGKE